MASQETVYFDNGKVKVTNSRVTVENQTYAMSGITSVQFSAEKPNRLLPLAVLILGVIFAKTLKDANIYVYLGAVLPGVVWFALQRGKYSVRIGSASGESKALTSKYADFVRNVVEAINKAIIDRG